jgi:Cu/Ag efflux protein CusF
MRKFLGILLCTTLVVCLIGFAMGWYLGWFTPMTERTPSSDGKVLVGVEVNTDKIKADTKDARERVEKAGDAVREKIQDLTGTTTVQGQIMNVDESARSLTVKAADGKEVTVQLAAQTEVKVKGKEGELKDLRPGDQVTVVYKSEDGKNLARSITADQGA